jgi:hypothetical protein
VSADAAVLAPGLVVRPWLHFFARFDLASRVSLHPGSRLRGKGVEPKRPPRAADAGELALLDGVAHSERPGVAVFTAPALLREHFEALDPDELPAPGTPRPSKAWLAFAEDVAAYLTHLQAPLRAPYGLSLDVRDPEDPPPLLTLGSCRALLQRSDGPGEPTAFSAAAHLNLGEVPAALVFWNVPIPQMAAMLASEGGPPPPDAPGLVLRFADRFPLCPLVRLTLAPGEGAFVPYLLLAHDIDASGASDLVVTLTAHPGPAGAGSPPSR